MTDLSLVDPAWETIDPNPNIWTLFGEFDKRFFNGKLTSSFVELMWSSGRMTSTAGLCAWNPRTNYATIKLSQPLLQLRSRADLVETLLHEMIHAFLFVTRQDDNHESHGPKFHMHMFRINKEAGTNITVYHTFHDEVKHYQQHIWRCNGSCASKAPYFGYVRRASNRKPGSYDYWWATHQANCGGTFIKVSEPEKVVKPKPNPKNKSTVPTDLQNNKRIDDFFKISSPIKSKSTIAIPSSSTSKPTLKTPVKTSPIRHGDIRKYVSPIKPEQTFPGKGHRLGSSLESNPIKKLKLEDVDSNEVSSSQDIKISQPVHPLPDLIPEIIDSQTEEDDEDDSFTYDLPDIDLNDSIVIETVKIDQLDVQNSQKSTKPVQLNSTIQTNDSQKSTQKEDEDEDVFTYELPNFIPFFGTGFRLGSTNQNKSGKLNNNQYSTRGISQKPQIINID